MSAVLKDIEDGQMAKPKKLVFKYPDNYDMKHCMSNVVLISSQNDRVYGTAFILPICGYNKLYNQNIQYGITSASNLVNVIHGGKNIENNGLIYKNLSEMHIYVYTLDSNNKYKSIKSFKIIDYHIYPKYIEYDSHEQDYIYCNSYNGYNIALIEILDITNELNNYNRTYINFRQYISKNSKYNIMKCCGYDNDSNKGEISGYLFEYNISRNKKLLKYNKINMSSGSPIFGINIKKYKNNTKNMFNNFNNCELIGIHSGNTNNYSYTTVINNNILDWIENITSQHFFNPV